MIVSSLTCISLGIVIAVLIRLLLKWRNRNLVYSLLPGPKYQHPILGDLPILVGRSKSDGINFCVMFYQSMLGLSHLFRKNGLYRIWMANDPYVILFSAETLEPILSNQTLIDKGNIYNIARCWLKNGLLTSTGNKWKERRKLLTPAFHFKILDEFIPIFDQHSKQFVKKISAYTEMDWVDITPLVTVFALEVICETAMGIKTRSNEAEFAEYVNAVIGFSELHMKRFTNPWLQNDLIFSLTSDYKRLKKILDILHGFTSKIMKQKKEELLNKFARTNFQETNASLEDNLLGIKRRQAFLDLLLQTQFRDSSLSDEDICEEVDTFMFAGHDTTSAGMSWALYHLGLHPDIQENIYQELQEILGDEKDREITLKDINEMKYLERVIKECQRISPSVPMIVRLASEDVNIKGYTIPRGTSILLFISSLHLDPSVFPNPEIFDPDRFLVENSLERHPFSYIPFSAGLRNCIGQRFAMMEMKVVICNIVRNFVLESLDSQDRVLTTPLIILRPAHSLRLKFRKRD